MALPCYNLGLNQVNSLYGLYQFQQITLNDYYVRATNQQWGYGQTLRRSQKSPNWTDQFATGNPTKQRTVFR